MVYKDRRRDYSVRIRGRKGQSAMTIYPVLQDTSFGPEELSTLGTAYERTLAALGLTDRQDPMTELVARKLLAIHQNGVCDPVRLSKLAVDALAP
jgi:hypothetical protein